MSGAPIAVYPKSSSTPATTDELLEKILNVLSLTKQVASRRRLKSGPTGTTTTTTTVNKPTKMEKDVPELYIRVKDVDDALTKQFLAVHSERADKKKSLY